MSDELISVWRIVPRVMSGLLSLGTVKARSEAEARRRVLAAGELTEDDFYVVRITETAPSP